MKTFRPAFRFAAPLLAFALPLFAQSPDPLKTWGPMFSINGLYLSSPNSSGGIGVKKWLTPHSAVVAGVFAGYNSRTVDTPDSVGQDQDFSDADLALNLGYQLHAPVGAGFSPYLAGGATAGFGWDEERRENFSTPSRVRYRNASIAFNAGGGIEYWFTRRISLAAQQVLTARFASVEREDADPANGSTQRDVNFSVGASSLLLTIYL